MESEVDEEESRDSGGSECERCQENEVVGFGVGYAGDTQGSRNYKITSSKGKYYKQTYRTAWEQMPDFKGWLRGVQGEPTRAFCIYCQKTLHAHRLSLLKHTCTIRHQKAAQIHSIKMNKKHITVQCKAEVDNMLGGSSSAGNDAEMEAGGTLVEYGEEQGVTVTVLEDGDQDQDEQEEDEDEEGEAITLETLPVQLQKQFRQQVTPMATNTTTTTTNTKPPISTHVLDTSKGQPVAGLQVSLYKLIDGRWTYINEGLTNPDGRFSNFLERSGFSTGRYKLHYDVDRYFEAKKQESLYPFIEIVIDCRGVMDHYHVPLLLSPYGYTTYRGS